MANGKKNVFKQVRKELKKVIWPTKDQWKKTSAVVLAVVLFFAIYLGLVHSGAKLLLDKTGFYKTNETTTDTSVAVPEDESDISYGDLSDLDSEEVTDEEMVEETEASMTSVDGVATEATSVSSVAETVSDNLDGNAQ